jgi:hypothetical protein
MVLEQDQYTTATIGSENEYVIFTLKNLKASRHAVKVSLTGLRPGAYDVFTDGDPSGSFTAASGDTTEVTVTVDAAELHTIVIKDENVIPVKGRETAQPPNLRITRAGSEVVIRVTGPPRLLTSSSISIFEPSGRRIAHYTDLTANQLLWDPRARNLADGIYIIRFSAGADFSLEEKVLYMN